MASLRLLITSALVASRASILWVSTPDLSLGVDDSTGEVARLNTSRLQWNVSGFALAGENGVPPIVQNVSVSPCMRATGPAVCVDALWLVHGQKSDASCCEDYVVAVTQVFWAVPALAASLPSALGWTVSFSSNASAPWRTALKARLQISSLDRDDSRFWVARSGDDGANKKSTWEDVLRMLSARDAVNTSALQYGVGFLCDPSDSGCMGQLMSVPVSFHASASAGAGVGVIPALDDAIFGLNMDVNLEGVSFMRNFNRLAGHAGAVNVTYFFVPVDGVDWRPVFLWARAAFPRYFLSSSLLAGTPLSTFTATSLLFTNQLPIMDRGAGNASILPPPPSLQVGLGLYSCANVADMNLTEVRDTYGASLNWDAHFYWPYIGLYLPPISPPSASWQTNFGSGEEPNCGAGFRHGQEINAATIGAEYRASRAAGMPTLAYFNTFEFGENFSCTPLPPIAPPPPNDWENATQFLADHFPDAVLPGCPGTGWQDGVTLDPTVSSFADYLVSQATFKVSTFGDDFAGIAVDRFDHVSAWRHAVTRADDDGLAWCGDPCYPLLSGFNRVGTRISDAVYESRADSGRLVTGNYVGSQRVDTLQWTDGIFSEDYSSHLRLVYSSGLSSTGLPITLLWTYSATEILSYPPNADAYFAQHVLHKAQPFAPVLGNDHSIQPAMDSTGAIHSLYASWAPIFKALRGACWWLAAEPVRVEATSSGGSASANGFTVGGGCTDPSDSGTGAVSSIVVFVSLNSFDSAAGDTVTITLANDFGGPSGSSRALTTCSTVTPGGTWQSVPSPLLSSGRWLVQPLALVRGAVLLRCAVQ